MLFIFTGNQVPPDDPIFNRGASFVFKHELPASTGATSEEETQPPSDSSDNSDDDQPDEDET